jgi:hypothetical protein
MKNKYRNNGEYVASKQVETPKGEPIKVQIARLEDKMAKSKDNLERALIYEKLEGLKKQLEEQNKRTNGKIKTVTEAPSVMDRKTYEPYNGHDLRGVNGVYDTSMSGSMVIPI